MKYVFFFCLFIFTTNTFSQNKKLKNIYSENNRIGIGTKYPDELLTVKGNIHTQEVIVDLKGAVAPDYVFETYYTTFSKLNPTFTPNLYEARALVGSSFKKLKIEEIYQLLKERYCCQFIITGGDSLSNYSAEYVEIDGQIHVVKSKKSAAAYLVPRST